MALIHLSYKDQERGETLKSLEIEVLLVRPQYSSNVGACARSMGNMGAKQLHLLAPQCDWQDLSARQGAAGCQEPLENLSHYLSWDDFLARNPEGLRLALSAREGKSRRSWDLRDLWQDPNNLSLATKKIYLVLGPEDDGLSADDILRCHLTAKIPIFGEFKSLNLAQACLLAQYIVQQSYIENKESRASENDLKRNTGTEEMEGASFFPYPVISSVLSRLGFNLDSPKTNAARKLTDIVMRAVPNQEEGEFLNKIFYQILRKLPEGKK